MRKYSILIVDDEDNVSKLLDKVLSKEGYLTYTAETGEKALDIINEHRIDVVITDIKMPKMSGIELLKRIKEIDLSINVVMITAFATLETAIDALRMGAKDYITKPFNLDEIVNTIRVIISNFDSSKDDGETEIYRFNDKDTDNSIVAESASMKNVMKIIKQVSDSKTTVILYGETGTGKELAAHAIHNLSPRKDKPFIKVNCAAIPEHLLESELFGYERGAFTGAVTRKPGRFELADGGSIFLDEIGDISPSIQVKLLNVIQEREFQHLGGTKTIKVDVRIIAATNKNLEKSVAEGNFRQDLFYRLNVVPITIPSLRERYEDIGVLIEHFLYKSALISNRPPKKITERALEKLMNYKWPGNIRELENVIERCVVITSGDYIDIEDLPPLIVNFNIGKEETSHYIKLDDAVDTAERDIISKTLNECGGNRTKASIILGISRRSLQRKILKYNIED